MGMEAFDWKPPATLSNIQTLKQRPEFVPRELLRSNPGLTSFKLK